MVTKSKIDEVVMVGYHDRISSSAVMKFSVVDLGFNSLKLFNYEVDHRGNLRAFEGVDAKVKLGEGLDETGYLLVDSVNRTISTLKVFRDLVSLRSIDHVFAAATSPVRDAVNGMEFLERVLHETGFRFKVLTGEEEAMYSYVGSNASVRVPDGIFFDLGGGSLDVVCSQKYTIKKIVSLPLGARRLTYLYGNERGGFSRKAYRQLAKRVYELFPSRKSLGVGKRARLVGAGGTMRAVARFHQDEFGYPLDKVHNYTMKYEDISDLGNLVKRMSPGRLKKIEAFGRARSETMVAGLCVIKVMMKKLEFEEITTSVNGLREGILRSFAKDPDGFLSGRLERRELERRFVAEMKKESGSSPSNQLLSLGMVNEKEYAIVSLREDVLAGLRQSVNMESMFIQMMGVETWLDHRQQLILALSVIHSKNEKAAERILKRYGALLRKGDIETMRRLSAINSLLDVLANFGKEVDMDLNRRYLQVGIRNQASNLPAAYMSLVASRFSEVMGMPMKFLVHGSKHQRGLVIGGELRA